MSNKQGRGFSTKFEDHTGLLHRFAKTTFGYLCKFEVPVEYDDVFQEAGIGFTKARDGYDCELGFTFSAYMGRAVCTHLKRYSDRLIKERQELGMKSVDGMLPEDDEGASLYDIYDGGAPSIEDSYFDAIEAGQRMRSLTPQARLVVARLVREVTTGDKEIEKARDMFAKVMDECGVDRAGRTRIFKELYSVYEVTPRSRARSGE